MKLILALLFLVSLDAHAGLVRHELVLNISTVGFLVNDGEPLCNPAGSRLGCDYSPGDSIVGRFDVDESLLLTDGRNISAPIFNFFLSAGLIVFDQQAEPLLFWHVTELDRFSTPAFTVEDGAIVSLMGGVMNSGDSRFIDFESLRGPARGFRLSDQRVVLAGTQAVRVAQVSEPSVLWLVLLPLLWIGIRR